MIHKRIESFQCALRGIRELIRSQLHAKIHLTATLTVIALGFYFSLNSHEWAWMASATTLVWLAEAFNTSLEFLADALHPKHHPLIGKAKDIAAGGVLIAAIYAILIAALIFYPHFTEQ